ncbi:hypothetical protein [Bradyrhizobium elkanii]|uniref:Transcriptional regulator of NAD metabolism n=1 Tax=Bradyrhizobium elkanii TaxID=29448 RepID=A0ABV4F1I8_BRAEL|nr:hypothetical protein [Bradyrhizobium elkanii]MCP1758226.1 transcriptional regulator of NAD metabolism [Bradyrhizobium elkanii]MCP1983542.1 transcriptional regulator of NAD metabolism [Bradyrhizobium elkanii]MCS3881477.1 transcriptional regulator of NAD metabolism [Bradyrhizobium elkanii]MCS4219471.1 transcriptional regulator of NAD metabolism [Bradyrhizobium elkanii]MCW2210550.1 transcriptional regulator of NAD metabolism [Bradyrhizobium elkanii]
MIANNTIDDCDAIIDHATLLCVLTTAPDAETCLNQVNRLMWVIIEHAGAIKEREVENHIPSLPPRPKLSVVAESRDRGRDAM